jgi:hypothetical protein
MQRAGSCRSWPVLGAGLVILVGVAAAGRWLTRASVSNQAVASGGTRVAIDVVWFLFVAILLFGSACLILSVASGGLFAPVDAPGERSRRGPLLASMMIVLLLAVMLGIWFLVPHPPPAHPPHARAGAVPPVTSTGPPVWTRSGRGDWWLVAGSLLVGAGVLALWARARHREARPLAGGMGRGPLSTADPEEMEVADDGLDPATESDPRRAVVIAYHRLLTTLAGRGRGRRRSEAPLEHLDRVLVARPAAMDPARSLVATFERAEYSDHAITGEDRNQALSWLAAVLADLDVGQPEPRLTEPR